MNQLTEQKMTWTTTHSSALTAGEKSSPALTRYKT